MKKPTMEIELQQDWDNIAGVSEEARAKVKAFLNEEKVTIDSNGSRFDNKPQ